MHITGQRKQIPLGNHAHGFFAGGRGSLFQVQLRVDRNHEHIVFLGLTDGHQGLEHLGGFLVQQAGDILSGQGRICFI